MDTRKNKQYPTHDSNRKERDFKDSSAYLDPEIIKKIMDSVKDFAKLMDEQENKTYVKISTSQCRIAQCEKCWEDRRELVYHDLEYDHCPVCGAVSRYQFPVVLSPYDNIRIHTKDPYFLPENHPAVIEMHRQMRFRDFQEKVSKVPYSDLKNMILILQQELESRPADRHLEYQTASEFEDVELIGSPDLARINKRNSSLSPLNDEDVY